MSLSMSLSTSCHKPMSQDAVAPTAPRASLSTTPPTNRTFPPFTVTSSTCQHDGPLPQERRALNPAAKEFELPVDGVLSTLAAGSVPVTHTAAKHTSRPPPAHPRGHGARYRDTNHPNTSSTATNFTHTWTMGLHRAESTQLSDDAAHEQLTQYIREMYTSECLSKDLHMVSVFNLEPRTSKKQLSSMFFPMGASEAAMLEPTTLPRHLAHLCHPGKRRAGIVFFTRKDFAMVGVEKLDHFVPIGQHQPLVVRYCGPDAESLTLHGAALPTSETPTGSAPPTLPWILPSKDLERVHEEMRNMYNTAEGLSRRPLGAPLPMVAVHGLDPFNATHVLRRNVMTTGVVGCEPWPPPQTPSAATWKCRSVSAVVWFASEECATTTTRILDGKVPEGQPQAVRLVVLTPTASTEASGTDRGREPQATTLPAGSTTLPTVASSQESVTAAESLALFAGLDQYFLQHFPDDQVHLVGVHNLDGATDNRVLYSIFYPMGALSAELFPGPIHLGGKLRRSGVALFSSQGMAMEAASKMNDFVPHEQTRPLLARYLWRDGASTSTPLPQSVVPAAPDLGGSSTPRKGSPTTPVALLEAIHALLNAPQVNATTLADLMLRLVLQKDSDEDVALRLATMLSSVLIQMKHRSVTLGTPLSCALLTLHESLSIRRRTFNAGKEGCPGDAEPRDAEEARRFMFVRHIARAMMLLLSNNKATREPRNVAAVLCAYLFQYAYLPGSPYSFAVTLLRSNEAQWAEAKMFLAREAGVPTTAEEEQKNQPWVTLVDSLEVMTSLWRRQNKSRAKKDDALKEYEALVMEFYGGCPRRSVGLEEHGGRCHTPKRDDVDATTAFASPGATSTAYSKRTALATPSARPTPRRILTRLSSGNGGTRATVLSHGMTDPTATPTSHVVLSPGGESMQGLSVVDVSFESQSTPHSAVSRVLHNMHQAPSSQTPCTTVALSATTIAPSSHLASPVPAVPAAARPDVQAHRSDNSECTVYVTKLPSHFLACQVRRLLLHFGQFNKVRLCRDEKEGALPFTTVNPSQPSYSKLCFGFVEFVDSFSAKSMVEYFRNAVHTAESFDFLRKASGDDEAEMEVPFTEDDIQLLKGTRTSQARSPIHDQQKMDAILRPATLSDGAVLVITGALIRTQRCMFGILHPNTSIGSYSECCQESKHATAHPSAIQDEPAGDDGGLLLPGSPLDPFEETILRTTWEEEDDVERALQAAVQAMQRTMNEATEGPLCGAEDPFRDPLSGSCMALFGMGEEENELSAPLRAMIAHLGVS